MSTAASESRSASSWSPSTPKARMARSMSPTRVNTSSMSAELCSVSKASNVIVSTRSAPRSRSSRRERRERRGVARREHDRAGAPRDERAQGGVRDVGPAAEHEHRLHRPQRILHGSLLGSVRSFAAAQGRPRRRRRSDWRTPAGSTRARSSAKRSRSGYITRQELGPQARVLRQVHAPADTGHELVEVVEQRGEPGHDRRDVERERPSRRGERQRPGVRRRRSA